MIMSHFKNEFFWLFAVWAATMVFPLQASAQPGLDVGMVMSASGNVRYMDPNGPEALQPVQAFMKIRQGDRIVLANAGKIELLFLRNGRRETWAGPVSLTLTSTGAVSDDPKATPEASLVQARISLALKDSGLPLPRGRIEKSAMAVVKGGLFDKKSEIKPRPVRVLGDEDQAKLAEARQICREMRQKAHPDDPLPDLYILNILAQYEKFGEMKPIIDRLRRTNSDSPALDQWEAWVHENHPVRLSLFLLQPDSDCREGPACLDLGSLGWFHKSGPFQPYEMADKTVETGDILTFSLANTSESVQYVDMVNITYDGKVEHLFPFSDQDPEAARLDPGEVLDLLTNAGVGMMPEHPGIEIIRVFLKQQPFSASDRQQFEKYETSVCPGIEVSVLVKKRGS